jgi:hypothetical protein
MLIDDQTDQQPYDGYAWLKEYEPVSRAGRILIYHIPPE